MIQYLSTLYPQAKVIRTPTIRSGQGADGYGKKITTDYSVELEGKRYPVFAICYSNAASHYATINKRKVFLLDGDVSDNVRRGVEEPQRFG